MAGVTTVDLGLVMTGKSGVAELIFTGTILIYISCVDCVRILSFVAAFLGVIS